MPFALVGRWAGGGAIARLGAGAGGLVDAGRRRSTRRTVRRRRLGRLPRVRARRARRAAAARRRRGPIRSRARFAFYDHVLRMDAAGSWWFEALTTARAAASCSRGCRRRRRRAGRGGSRRCARAGRARPGTARRWPTASSGSRPASSSRRTSACGWRARSRVTPLDLVRRRAAGALQPAYGAYLSTGVLRASRRSSSCAATAASASRADQGHGAPRDRRPRALEALGQGPRRARDDRRPDAQRPRARGRVRVGRRARSAPTREAAPGRLASRLARCAAGCAAAWATRTLLRATFPPGSVTGAPKIQAMKVISALEGDRRARSTRARSAIASPLAGLELTSPSARFEVRGDAPGSAAAAASSPTRTRMRELPRGLRQGPPRSRPALGSRARHPARRSSALRRRA